MGHQIIKQPDGKFAIFSSMVDSWILFDATPQQIVDYYCAKAYAATRDSTTKLLELIQEEPHKAYYQFAMTFEEADQIAAVYGGTLDFLRKQDSEEK